MSQLELFPTPGALRERLHAAGLSADTPVIAHANRRVLVSRTPGGALRVHQGYAAAPDEVIAAIARWARPRIRRRDRLEAQRILAAFPVQACPPVSAGAGRRPPAPRPGGERIAAKLHELHAAFNRLHFGNALGRVRIGLSSRMRRRLGEFRQSATDCHEIVIGRRHLRRRFDRIARESGVAGRGMSLVSDCRPPTPDSRLPTPDSRLPITDSRHRLTTFRRLSMEP